MLWESFKDFCGRKSTQIVTGIVLVATGAFAGGVAYQKNKESIGNMPLDDDQLNRISNGNVLRFSNPCAGPNSRLLVFKNNPPAYSPVQDDDEDDYDDED